MNSNTVTHLEMKMPDGNNRHYYYGSLSAIFSAWNPADVGVNLRALYNHKYHRRIHTKTTSASSAKVRLCARRNDHMPSSTLLINFAMTLEQCEYCPDFARTPEWVCKKCPVTIEKRTSTTSYTPIRKITRCPRFCKPVKQE